MIVALLSPLLWVGLVLLAMSLWLPMRWLFLPESGVLLTGGFAEQRRSQRQILSTVKISSFFLLETFFGN